MIIRIILFGTNAVLTKILRNNATKNSKYKPIIVLNSYYITRNIMINRGYKPKYVNSILDII